MIRKRLLHLLIAIAVLTLVNGETTAFAADTAPDSDQTWADDGTPEPPNSGFADASELANLRDLSSVDPRNVYRVEDLERYGTFRPHSFASADASAPQALYESEWISAGNCTYKQRGDDPHWSDGKTTISVHGWWIKKPGTSCPKYANVDTYLQAKWCNTFGCSFTTIAEDHRDVRAGGGSGRRGNARNGCSGSDLIAYRGAVDIDLIGQDDPPGLSYSDSYDFNCYPA